jgi:hypothetical protein
MNSKDQWGLISSKNRNNLIHVGRVKAPDGSAADWDDSVGFQIPDVMTTFSELLKDEADVEKITAAVKNILGPMKGSQLITADNGSLTGEVLIKTESLSGDGCRLLIQGFWTCPGANGDEWGATTHALFMNKNSTVGTAAAPRYSLQANEEGWHQVRWDSRSREYSFISNKYIAPPCSIYARSLMRNASRATSHDIIK